MNINANKIVDQIASLPLERRALFELLLKQQGIDVNRLVILPRPAGMDRVPPSFGQERLWFIEQLNPGGSAYNIPATIWLDPQTSVRMLEASLGEVVRRHESLRTVFRQEAGQPIQLIEPPRPARIPLIDLGELGEAASRAEIDRLTVEDAGRGFDLTLGPLMRASVARLGDGRQLLLLTMHHIISDGWSMGVLVNEIKSVYEAYAAGKRSPLEALKIQYADYAIWQRERMSGESLERELDYWEEHLRGAPRMIELPTDRPRGAEMNRHGRVVNIELDEEVSEELRKVSREEGATLYIALMAGLKVLLSRLSGQAEITLGTPVAGRSRMELERMIGFFVNTLALKTEVRGEESYRELLRRVREVVIEGQAHEEAPFEKVVERLQPERSLSHTPLFQVMFAFNNNEDWQAKIIQSREPSEKPATGTVIEGTGEQQDLKFDLSIALGTQGRKIIGSVGYNRRLWDEETIKRMMRLYERTLRQAAANPDVKIKDIELLSEEEKRQAIEDWNRTEADYESERSLASHVEEQAALRPGRTAVVSGRLRMSYRELENEANRLARYLIRQGVEAEQVVGICLERSPRMVVGLLGILKAGGAYAPLDAAYPAERLAYMVEDAGMKLILTEEKLKGSLPASLTESGVKVISLEDIGEELERESEAGLESRAEGGNLAYVIYTSGSTGKPKGVSVEQRSVARLVKGANYARLGEEETILQFAPAPFDAATFEIWGALCNGAKLAIAPAEVIGLEDLAKEIKLQGVTVMWLTSALFQQMVEGHLEGLKGVKQLLAGGDTLPVAQVRKAVEGLEGCRVINGYGPTENTTFTTTYEVRELRRIEYGVPIGRPISNTQAYILDENHKVAPVGVIGELYAGGDGLARGYLNRPEVTAEKFTPNPFSQQPGQRLYKTGDLCRYLPGGEIEFIGRKDGQIKLRGYRIELGEIENALAGAPGVKEAVVEVRQDKNGEKRLVAYIVSDSVRVENKELKRRLSEKLPEYMVPGVYVELEELPVTANGKIDRRGLPEPDTTGLQDGIDHVAPRNATEIILAGIWAELLGLDQVGVRSNFFDLGGHSLAAIRLVGRIKEAFGEAFGQSIPAAAVFERPTIEEMAAYLHQHHADTPQQLLVPIQPRGGKRPLFCIHPAGGNVFCYAPLAARLGNDQPVYAIQSPALTNDRAGARTIEAMADLYIEAIRQAQPEGPYMLAGWSMGGVVAFEMSRQLRLRGERVDVVALIDSMPVQGAGAPDRLTLLARFGRDLGIPREMIEAARARLSGKDLDDSLGDILEKAIELDLLPGYLGVPEIRRLFSAFERNVKAMFEYTPGANPGPVSLFAASHSHGRAAGDPARGWTQVVRDGVEIFETPGDHYSIMSHPQVEVLAKQLRVCLDREQ